MATAFTLEAAESRAQERRDSNKDSFTVWRHIRNLNDYIVKTTASSAPRDFVKVVTFWDTGEITRYGKS